MILEGSEQKWNYEFISLEYDVEKVIEDLYISGLVKKAPAWCKVSEHLLRTGEISHGTVLAKAMELCGNELGECNWPNVPEKYWDLAVQDMFICPKRGSWTKDDTLYGDYGTTIRVPMMDNPQKWNIVYISKWSVDRLISEQIDGDIIQNGINKDANDTTLWQWNFRKITENTF